MKKKRIARVKRRTKETDIDITLNLDGSGRGVVSTGIPFLDHMLHSLAKHAAFDLKIKAKGDLEIDLHHTNEDVGIVLGQCLAKALGAKRGIRRFGFFSVPMDEALVRSTLDISGRPSFYLLRDRKIRPSSHDAYTMHDACEFLRSFTQQAGINLAVEIVAGEDGHHVIEAIFKSIAKALDVAVQIDPRMSGVPSTKGTL